MRSKTITDFLSPTNGKISLSNINLRKWNDTRYIYILTLAENVGTTKLKY